MLVKCVGGRVPRDSGPFQTENRQFHQYLQKTSTRHCTITQEHLTLERTMPKVSKVGRFRATAAVDKEKQNITVSTTSCSAKDKVDALMTTTSPRDLHHNHSSHSESLSRGQRRRLAKREQYLKREHMILSSLRLSREQEQKNKIDGFDSLWKALPAVSREEDEAGRSDNSQVIRKNKQKKNIAVEEVVHYNLVLQHPSFQSNPFETMQEHLRNTLAKSTEEPTNNSSDKALQEMKGVKNVVKSKVKVQSKHSNYRREKKNDYSATQPKPPKRHGVHVKRETKK